MRALVFSALLCVSAVTLRAEPVMTRIVAQVTAPEISPGSFAAKPKTFYLAGKKYARVEEQLNPETGIHGLIITNEPDTWMINRRDKTARHFVDPGPTFIMHAPVFWVPPQKGAPDPYKYFKELEFGEEAKFFRERRARDLGLREIDSRNCRAFSLTSGGHEAILFLDEKTGKPRRLDLLKSGKPELSVRYLSYESGIPFDKSLFQPPAGVKIVETK